MNGPIQRPRPRTMGTMNPLLRDKKPRMPGGGGMQTPGVVPGKMASGATDVRKRALVGRAMAAGKMKGATL